MKQLLGCLVCVLLSAGCATMRGDEIQIVSTPDGADVIANGKSVGATPYILQPSDLADRPSIPINILLKKDGYEPVQRTIQWTRIKKFGGSDRVCGTDLLQGDRVYGEHNDRGGIRYTFSFVMMPESGAGIPGEE